MARAADDDYAQCDSFNDSCVRLGENRSLVLLDGAGSELLYFVNYAMNIAL